MNPAHRREAITARERPAQPRVDLGFAAGSCVTRSFATMPFASRISSAPSRGSAELSANDVAQPIKTRFELQTPLA